MIDQAFLEGLSENAFVSQTRPRRRSVLVVNSVFLVCVLVSLQSSLQYNLVLALES